ncbi:hypothetical protein ACFQZF_11255 [Flavobacterium myungsuense]
MTEFIFTERISNISSLQLDINNIRRPLFEKTFRYSSNGQKFILTDVQFMKYKRNRILEKFNSMYSSIDYTWLEIGFDFSVNTRVSEILLKLKRNLTKIGVPMAGYIWLIDKGDLHGIMHFHLIVAIPRLDLKGKTLPDCLKLKFKNKKIHSSFVTNKPKMIDYLLKKEIYFIGKRKRVYGKSRNIKV